ncbi:MAG: DUF418 domain-containing protein [Planctomycetota bacterium]
MTRAGHTATTHDSTATDTSPGPVQAGERLGVLDAIRGMALVGILLANLMAFFGVDLMNEEERRAIAGRELGEAVLFGINWLVEGKFYSVFSILLGIGFALQCQRALARGSSRSEFDRFFRRRMSVLIGIGLLHMFVVWCGDILTLYGVMGLLLPFLARGRGTTRAAWIVVLLCVPFATHLLVYATEGQVDPRVPFAGAGQSAREALGGGDRSSLELFAEGGWADYYAWNTGFAVARPGSYLLGGRPAHVLALFLIGAWIGTFLLPRLSSLRRSLHVTAVLGAVVGLPTSFLYAVNKAEGYPPLLSTEGLTQTALYAVGTTPLALSYLALAVLCWRKPTTRGLLLWFVPLGRMALSVYVSQSLIQLAVFSGGALGLAARSPSTALLPIAAAAILIPQRYACVWWLGRYDQGPLEWVWRRLTYRKPANRLVAGSTSTSGDDQT